MLACDRGVADDDVADVVPVVVADDDDAHTGRCPRRDRACFESCKKDFISSAHCYHEKRDRSVFPRLQNSMKKQENVNLLFSCCYASSYSLPP